ncbi:hypothetical protein TraAM80_05993, partial [Trypanosoma rangeli]
MDFAFPWHFCHVGGLRVHESGWWRTVGLFVVSSRLSERVRRGDPTRNNAPGASLVDEGFREQRRARVQFQAVRQRLGVVQPLPRQGATRAEGLGHTWARLRRCLRHRRLVEKRIAGTCRRKVRSGGSPALGGAWGALGAPRAKTPVPSTAPRPPLRERVNQGAPGPRCRRIGKRSGTRRPLRRGTCALRRSTCRGGPVEGRVLRWAMRRPSAALALACAHGRGERPGCARPGP